MRSWSGRCRRCVMPSRGRVGPGSAAVGVAEGEVSGAEGELPDLEVGDVLGQLPPWLVEAGEIGDERGVQVGDPCPQRPQPWAGPFAACRGDRRAGTQMVEDVAQRRGDCMTSWTAQNMAASAVASMAAAATGAAIRCTLSQPCSATRSAATCSICSEASIPMMVPVGPTLWCSSGRHSPVPQPTSSTVSPRRGGAARPAVRASAGILRSAGRSAPAWLR